MKFLLESILNYLPAFIYWIDIKNNYLGCNKRFADLIGLKSPHEIEGKNNEQLTYLTGSDNILKNMEEINYYVLKNKTPLTLEEKIEHNNQCLILKTYKVPLIDNNNFFGVLNFSFDITNEILEKSDFREEKDNIQVLLDNILTHLPTHIYWQNKNGVILGCNDKQIKSLGYKNREDVVGKKLNDLVPNHEATHLLNILHSVISTGKPVFIEEKITFRNGIREMMSQKIPFRDKNNNIIGLLGISIDITDRKNAERKLAEAIQAKNIFLSIISHEIKGPLSNIISILNMLQEEIEKKSLNSKECLKYIAMELQDAYRGIEVINYLQSFLNLGDSLSNETTTLHLGEELTKAVDIFEEENEKNLSFHIINDERISPIITLNKRVFEVIKIFLSNAVKYSKKNGEIFVRSVHSTKEEGDYLTLCVEDQGKGIKKDVIKSLSVSLLGSSTIQSYTAPAIKLSYVKKLMELLGGTLSIESKENQGTTIAATLPYEKTTQEHKIIWTPSAHEEKTKISKRKLKFLIVEDNIVTSKLLSQILRQLRYKVDVASNAEDACELARLTDYDVVFMDISLPGINGVELRTKLCAPNSDKPFVIAVTSHDSQKDMEYFVDQGFLSVIKKPFLKEKVIECIEIINKVLDDMRNDF